MIYTVYFIYLSVFIMVDLAIGVTIYLSILA